MWGFDGKSIRVVEVGKEGQNLKVLLKMKMNSINDVHVARHSHG